MNIQDWFPLGLTGWICLQSEGLSRVFSNSTVQKHQSFGARLSLYSQLSHLYMTTGKNIALTRQAFVGKVMSLLLNMFSRLVLTFLPRSKRLLISRLQSPSAVILEPPKIKSLFPLFPCLLAMRWWEELPWSSFSECRALSQLFSFPFIFISCRLITLQYCSGFCHTLTWISHGFTCIPHPDPPSHLPLHLIPLGLPSAPALSTCLMHPTWAGNLFQPW